ncbi:uncharacterized protein KIAA1841, partial [Exaiptasia diaphana]|uniref:SANT and BTB domain-containing protein n=1 Tax=Exaiptasia diaphana TaxID=2652724 RepID=A0A913WUS7_EXADI
MAAVDLILKTLMCSKEFCEADDKNWDAVAKLIPGSTAQQCCKRWKELQAHLPLQYKMCGFPSQSSGIQQVISKLLKYDLINDSKSKTKKKCNSTKQAYNSMTKQSVEQEDNDGSEKHSLMKGQGISSPDQQKTHSKQFFPQKTQSSGRESVMSQGPNMVIHVCDESKNLKQDFNCPRDLLIREMRYFAEYLSVEAQRWEEVDISVHCDIQIFDWLMRYVKKGIGEKGKEKTQPQLEPNNVISILISSDFLKMDSLVTECVEYCHKSMSAIVATPCNMNCINDKLVT